MRNLQPIPFLNLIDQFDSISHELIPAVTDVLLSGQYVLGKEVEAFERDFAKRHNVEFAVAVSSGTAALHISLLALGIGPGDEVIIPSMTFTATGAAVMYTGATPIFADVLPGTFSINPIEIERRITNKTKAIIPVHLYGHPANMDEICKIASLHGVCVIEDAAQAHIATHRERPVGSIGDVGAFSFYPGKNLGACGEGGIVTTNSRLIAEKTRLLRDWGQKDKYVHSILGYNYRMDAIQGAVLKLKLKHLDTWTNRRISIARRYKAAFNPLNIKTMVEAGATKHVWHIFSILHKDRDLIRAKLAEVGISTGLHYPVPLHLQQPYQFLGYKQNDFPVSESLAKEQLSLPIYPEMSDDQVNRVIEFVSEFASESV
jgi:dTDP-4-amino-4,6-dideoxygalactose transaminase